ncbi:hypothetical protein PHA51_03565 [Rodentibacter pneumotropicus]|uniref:hypothetical protein n=1 Tax=Rodentibacter pneumotropicus TaxID=758 RepID=UPI00232DEC85|nr:hypothetical protein [Rodentibacter pneumotropicus]MDC2825116.1 hypothetical protein [Rodentibacter pneumotropicus]
MKIVKLIAITTICSTFVGCAQMHPRPQPPVDRWYKDGVSLHDANNKLAKCTYDVGMNKVEITEKNSLIVNCMRADGYRYGVPSKELQAWKDEVKSLQDKGYILY